MSNLKYVITGTGRCGTTFAAKSFCSAGIPCGHELVFRFHGVWPPRPGMVADSSLAALPFLDHPVARDAIVIHLVRYPLKVIGSLVGSQRRRIRLSNWEWLADGRLPLLRDFDNLAELSTYHWVEWNRQIEEALVHRDSRFCRVEDGLADTTASLPGETGTPTYSDTSCNNRTTDEEITLNDIPSGQWKDEMIKMGERYGYDLC